MHPFLVLLALMPAGLAASDCPVTLEAVERIRSERITGSLERAEAEARRLLGCSDAVNNHPRIVLSLELARILDRFGLHHNTRPVPEVFEILEEVDQLVGQADIASRAAIALSWVSYFYRAEMAERVFPNTTANARAAQRLYAQLEDSSGEAKAVHWRGLIELQKRNLKAARTLFERSLELAEIEGADLIFLSDYERHMALADIFAGAPAASIARLERSLALRDQAKSRDYGLFARTVLGSALTGAGRPAEARAPLDEALQIASELRSPVGELRATYYLAEMHEKLGEEAAALAAFHRARHLALSLGVTRLQQAAEEGVERLASDEEPPR